MKEKNNTIFNNFIFNALYNGMSVLFPVITIPYISRILLSDGLGKVNYVLNIVSWFLLFASLGLPRYGIRAIAKSKNNKNKLSYTFSELFWINLISTICCLNIFLGMIFCVPSFRERQLLYLVAGLQLALNVFKVDWFYQGMEEYRYITIRSFVIKVCSLIAMLIFVRKQEDYIVYAFIQSLAVAGNHICNFINLRKYIKLKINNLSLKKHLKAIFLLLSTQLAINIYALLDTTMIGIWCDDSTIGYYSNVHKIINMLATLTASLSGVILPRLVMYKEEGDFAKLKLLCEKTCRFILVICIPIMTGVFLLSEDIVRLLFGEDFLPSIITLKIFSPFILVTTIGNLFGTQILMAFEKEKGLLLSVSIGAIINFILNIFLIQMFKHNGAAIASVVTEFVVMCVQIALCQKSIKITLESSFLLKILISDFLMIIAVILVKNTIHNVWIETIMSTGMGVIVYFMIGILLKEENIIYLFICMGNKLKGFLSR